MQFSSEQKPVNSIYICQTVIFIDFSFKKGSIDLCYRGALC